MKLPNREQLAARYLDGMEKAYDAKLTQIETEIDNVLANSVANGDQHRIHEALGELFSRRADVQAELESLRDYRKDRGLSTARGEK